MSVEVTVYRWAPASGDMPLSQTTWRMYALPTPGQRYWHGAEGYSVREVDEAHERPRVHLDHDLEWTQAVNEELPDDYRLDGGRHSETGRWQFRAVLPDGRRVGDGYSDDMDEAMSQAIAHASEHSRGSRQAGA